MPSFGLTFLSRSALRNAERLMLGDTAGVRDEVGFLLVHQRYADRFFPGTSVLHTRLRYVLFVSWILERLKERGDGARFLDALRGEETALAERLKGEGYGVIGRLLLPAASNQPPSYVYWTALNRWGLVDPKPTGRAWSRAELGALIAADRGKGLRDDDGRPLSTAVWPIAELPAPPEGWDTAGPLSFDLRPRERRHLAKLIRAVRCPLHPNARSLLALLVGRAVADVGTCWDPAILDIAGDHRAALGRAGRAASLAAIGRGVYAALVERQKERDGGVVGRGHRDALLDVLARHAERAVTLDADLLISDLQPDLPPRVEDVLRHTLAWLRGGGRRRPSQLLDVYRRAETKRKGARARLSEDQSGVDRRSEWNAEEHPSAEPLHYRWSQVRLMLQDLEGA